MLYFFHGDFHFHLDDSIIEFLKTKSTHTLDITNQINNLLDVLYSNEIKIKFDKSFKVAMIDKGINFKESKVVTYNSMVSPYIQISNLFSNELKYDINLFYGVHPFYVSRLSLLHNENRFIEQLISTSSILTKNSTFYELLSQLDRENNKYIIDDVELIGEIGVDTNYNEISVDKQIELFEAQVYAKLQYLLKNINTTSVCKEDNLNVTNRHTKVLSINTHSYKSLEILISSLFNMYDTMINSADLTNDLHLDIFCHGITDNNVDIYSTENTIELLIKLLEYKSRCNGVNLTLSIGIGINYLFPINMYTQCLELICRLDKLEKSHSIFVAYVGLETDSPNVNFDTLLSQLHL